MQNARGHWRALITPVKLAIYPSSPVSCVKQLNVRRFFHPKSTETEMKILNVAEKNDAAKTISSILSQGRAKRREGLSKFNKIYEFSYRVLGQDCNMLMTSVSGHLLEYAFPLNFKNWESTNPAALFSAPVMKRCIINYNAVKATLEREVRLCHALIIWTDCDREGENIGYEVINVCTAVNPNLRVYRAKFSDMTNQSIKRASQTLIQPDKRVSDAVDVRQELDLRIGAAFTRFQTLRLRRGFPEVIVDNLVSYGSCQFPTLGFVVERYKQILDFVCELFWSLKVTHKVETDEAVFSWKRGRLFDRAACVIFHDICTESPLATVVDVQCKKKSKWRPLPLDTVELEKMASSKLRINAKGTMAIAEKLYTQGVISYPRTETNMFPKELNLNPLIEMQAEDAEWGAFAAGVLRDGPNPRQGKKSDQAHPPIHPTKYTNSLQGNDKKVYEFIVRRFLACVSKDAEGYETTVEIDISKERFIAKGLMITARNYLEVYPYEKWNDKAIPIYDVGQTFMPSQIEMTEGETTPPPLLSEADLIALMEKHGIGTDATHAEHIEKIKTRLYVHVQGDGRFMPSKLGMGLVEGYDAMGFEMSKPRLRAELETDLKRICEGHKDPNVVLQEQINKYKTIFIEAVRQAEKIVQALEQLLGRQATEFIAPDVMELEIPKVVMKCESCGSDMYLRQGKNQGKYFIGCSSYPVCRNCIWFPDSVLDVKVEETSCEECHPKQIKKLKFSFNRNIVPPWILPDGMGCIGGCNAMLDNFLDTRTGSSSSNRPNLTTPAPVQQQRPAPVRARRPSSSSSTRNPTPNRQQQATNARNGRQQQNRFESNRSGANSAVVCSCGQNAVLLTVKKQSPNFGRKFYKCGKAQHEGQCNFFLWADDNMVSGQSHAAEETERRQAAPTTSTNSTRKRKCGICGTEGHNKRGCKANK